MENKSQLNVIAISVIGLLSVAILAGLNGPDRLIIATLIGGLAGFSLYHSKFGFTGAWHRLVSEKRGSGLRSQLLLVGLTSVIAYPLFQYDVLLGLNLNGFVAPFGISAALGAFLFGIGMQLGGSCASGTLFTVGGGSTRMVITLFFFIIGSMLATAHIPMWNQLPRFSAFSFVSEFGAIIALLILFTFLGVVTFSSMFIELRHHGNIAASPKTESLYFGPWSYPLGAIMLVVVSIGTILVLGRPWGITSGLTLWGAKWFYAIGIPIDTWEYWSNRMGGVTRSVFSHSTSVMNFGIILGAMIAAGVAGRFRPVARVSKKGLITAVFGGILMGYGARLAYGCNIGAYLGGIISGSLHGWGWLVFGFLGSIVGSKFRDRFGNT